jgi:uncharacterized protein (DUF924 family)
MNDIGEIIAFWFSDKARTLWFEKDKEFDAEIESRFAASVHRAQMGDFEDWRRSAEGTLALLILLDQMARNIHRGAAKAFLGDRRAREIAEEAIRRGFDRACIFEQRRFFYLPYEHAEDMTDQDSRYLPAGGTQRGRGAVALCPPAPRHHPAFRTLSPSQHCLGPAELARGRGISQRPERVLLIVPSDRFLASARGVG